jgi:hypothetical protein
MFYFELVLRLDLKGREIILSLYLENNLNLLTMIEFKKFSSLKENYFNNFSFYEKLFKEKCYPGNIGRDTQGFYLKLRFKKKPECVKSILNNTGRQNNTSLAFY